MEDTELKNLKCEVDAIEPYQQRMTIVDDGENLIPLQTYSRFKRRIPKIFFVLVVSAMLLSVSFWAGHAVGIGKQSTTHNPNEDLVTKTIEITNANFGGESNGILNNGDIVTIRSLATKKYMSALPDSKSFGIGQQTKAQDWEKFELISEENGKFALKTYHNHYIRAGDAGNSWIIDGSSTTIDSWEKFTFYQLASGFYRLTTYHQKYVRANANSIDILQGTWSDDYEHWIITKVNDIEHDWKAYMQGINLGGWLVLENWITKPLMEGQNDEWSLIQFKGGPTSGSAVDLMNSHWDHWMTEDDIQDLYNFGYTHVRIPIGWWIVDYNVADGFVDGGWYYLDRMIGWIGERGMYAVLDLHAMPGAQTPYQSFTGKSEDQAYFFLDENNLERGKDVIMKLATKMKAYENDQDENKRNVLMGLELVNEPHDKMLEKVLEFYVEMVPKIRTVLEASRYCILLSIMNQPNEVGAFWADQTDWENVIFDRHIYHAYGDDDGSIPWTRHCDSCKTCCRDPIMFDDFQQHDTIIAEWALNTASWNEGNAKEADFLYEYFWHQISSYKWLTTAGEVGGDNSHSRGHFFWTAKIVDDDSDYWINFDMLKLIRWGILGNHLWSLDLSRQCPQRDLTKCPMFNPDTVQWNDVCYWQN